ncbi:DUF6714 family protein [Sinobacterium caligoides]|nr:DUF6714 family protein [Sinobacterium caligoides]
MPTMDRDQLVNQIEDAFRNVTLCNGVGIYEANTIDDYASEEERCKQRNRDIREDCKLISDDVIDQHYSVLSFMDEEGLRFCIPVYMRFPVRYFDSYASSSIDSIIYCLANQREWEFLSSKRKRVIANLLSFMVLEEDDNVDTYQASLAYENIWSQYESN